ncbi:thiamine phosphate synthase [Propioniciclava soli]|uniref:Thiamine-phosphate synthase n=1 Tax=Propioniciclava soli TaxID=2775081 RepID=A0ABZ3C6Y3_9ACTN
MGIDLRVYLVTAGSDRHTVEVAAAAAAAGAGIVQVRAKEASTRELLALLGAVADAVGAANPTTRVLVDDRADVAYAARRAGRRVHGVHLGADDLPPPAARALLGDDAVIGFTTGTLDLVLQAQSLVGVVDYLGAGPFRPTPTKDSGREPLGVEGYRPLVEASRLPIVAIGSVGVEDVADLAGTGVAGVAMVRAITGAADPADVVRRSLAAWDAVRPGAGRT